MNFLEAVAAGFKNYVQFNGRASRSEFWWWQLFYVILYAPTYIAYQVTIGSDSNGVFALLYLAVALALFLPTLALTVRRLHDTDHSGWWTLIAITIVGYIPLLIWYCSRGKPGANKYGVNPVAPPVSMIF